LVFLHLATAVIVFFVFCSDRFLNFFFSKWFFSGFDEKLTVACMVVKFAGFTGKFAACLPANLRGYSRGSYVTVQAEITSLFSRKLRHSSAGSYVTVQPEITSLETSRKCKT
jgi:hypothetical protein